jgi:hypothetical protein
LLQHLGNGDVDPLTPANDGAPGFFKMKNHRPLAAAGGFFHKLQTERGFANA